MDVTDTRAGLMATEKVVNEGSVNRYDFIKNSYEQHREYLIHDGHPPSNDVDIDGDDSSSSNSPAPASTTKAGKATPASNNTGSAPVLNNSKHLLELSAPPEEKK